MHLSCLERSGTPSGAETEGREGCARQSTTPVLSLQDATQTGGFATLSGRYAGQETGLIVGDESLKVEPEIASFQDALQLAVAARSSGNDRRRGLIAITYAGHVSNVIPTGSYKNIETQRTRRSLRK